MTFLIWALISSALSRSPFRAKLGHVALCGRGGSPGQRLNLFWFSARVELFVSAPENALCSTVHRWPR